MRPGDTLVLRLYCWAGGWKGGAMALRRSDGFLLLESAAEGCGSPAHPTYVDALVTDALAPPSPEPTPEPTPAPSPRPRLLGLRVVRWM